MSRRVWIFLLWCPDLRGGLPDSALASRWLSDAQHSLQCSGRCINGWVMGLLLCHDHSHQQATQLVSQSLSHSVCDGWGGDRRTVPWFSRRTRSRSILLRLHGVPEAVPPTSVGKPLGHAIEWLRCDIEFMTHHAGQLGRRIAPWPWCGRRDSCRCKPRLSCFLKGDNDPLTSRAIDCPSVRQAVIGT